MLITQGPLMLDHARSMTQSDRITHWIGSLPYPFLGRVGSKRRLDEISNSLEQTPMRRSKMATPNTEAEELDNSYTPRPPPLALANNAFPRLQPSPSASSISSIRSFAAHSDTASSQSRAAKCRRSESPKKRLENLSLARYPIVLHSIGTVRDLPPSAQKLAQNMRKCQLRVGILHPDSTDAMQPYLDIDDDLTERFFSEQRNRIGDSMCCADSISIVSQANENEAERASEAAWNGDVHTALLRMALRGSRWQEELRCDNV